MSGVNLSSLSAVETALFIKWVIPNFETAYLSDYNRSITFGGGTYLNIGKLLSVSSTVSELKASAGEVVIGLSGIPANSISDLLNRQIKGSTLEIRRGFFNPSTGALLTTDMLSISNPVLKFKGIVTNYEISDAFDADTGTFLTTMSLTCSSQVEVLSNKVSGRRTNPVDFTTDNSMKRVQALSNSNFNFGAPK